LAIWLGKDGIVVAVAAAKQRRANGKSGTVDAEAAAWAKLTSTAAAGRRR
jgi:hypothetical protein